VILLVHGWLLYPGFWRHQLGAFAARGYDVAAIDLRRARRRGDAIEDFAVEVVAAADARHPRDIVLIGHSMGGPVVIEAAIRLGSRCRLVVGIDTFTDAAFYAGWPPEEIARRTEAFASDFGGAMRAMVDRLIAPVHKPRVLPWVAEEMAAADPEAALWALRGLLAWDIGGRLPAARCPIETINSAWLDSTRNKVPGLDRVRVHTMEDVGHFPMLEAPERFNALALAILEQSLPA